MPGSRRSWRESAAAAADRPLGDEQVERPPGTLAEVAGEGAGAEGGVGESLGEHLGSGTEGERIGPDHPGTVAVDIAAPDRRETLDDAEGHQSDDDDPERIEQLPRPGLRVVEQR